MMNDGQMDQVWYQMMVSEEPGLKTLYKLYESKKAPSQILPVKIIVDK